LQVDEAKAPAHAFNVVCPKCQTIVNVDREAKPTEAPAVHTEAPPTPLENEPQPPFEKPATAQRFTRRGDAGVFNSTRETMPGLNDLAKVLAEALGKPGVNYTSNRTRPAWDRRKVLVCASPAYREVIAESLARNEYEVFVAENTVQGLGRMREEPMDVIVLDANFDPLEQGVAFITREVQLLRPAERRRLFLVYLAAGVRTMDVHAAFLQNVNLVVNPSDVEQLPEALDVSIRHYNDLYQPLNNALDVAPI
jgi:CheY-like chemotaxis protein